MKKFKKISIVTVLAIALVIGFTPPIPAHAATATAPTLGTAEGYSVFGAAGITNTGLGLLTNLWGDAGDNGSGHPGLLADQVDGTLYTIGQAIGVDITAAYGLLDAQTGPTAKSLSGTVTVTPGLYTVIPAETLNGTVTLDGAGVYVFRSTGGGFTVAPNATMNLINGATACNVFWEIYSSMTIGAGAHVEGTIITSQSHITLGTGAVLKGRALAGGAGQVTLLSNQITEPVCAASPTLNVIKHVSGGTASASDWVLTVASSNGGSGTSYADGAESPGTAYTLETGHQYSVTENAGTSGYTSSLSNDCTIASAEAGTTYTCTITNTYRRPSSSGSSIARVVVPVFQPTINILSTPVVAPVVIIPKLPKTGFPPQESGTWYESLLNNILNLFR